MNILRVIIGIGIGIAGAQVVARLAVWRFQKKQQRIKTIRLQVDDLLKKATSPTEQVDGNVLGTFLAVGIKEGAILPEELNGIMTAILAAEIKHLEDTGSIKVLANDRTKIRGFHKGPQNLPD